MYRSEKTANCLTKTKQKSMFCRGVFFIDFGISKKYFLKNFSFVLPNIKGATFIDFAQFSRSYIYSTPYVRLIWTLEYDYFYQVHCTFGLAC